MSAEKKQLFSMGYVTDHDCGNYYIGEIDGGFNGLLTGYLERYGQKGLDDLLRQLAFAQFHVIREFQSTQGRQQVQCEASIK